MSTLASAAPVALKPFLSLGVDLNWEGRIQAAGDCPFCGKDGGKFCINSDNGLWDCKSCGSSGNGLTFLRLLWERSQERTTEDDLAELAADRGLLDSSTLEAWGVVVSFLTGDWLVPGFNRRGAVVQLYCYRPDPKTGKRRLLAAAGLAHGLFGASADLKLNSPSTGEGRHKRVYVCEGPWDGMALWELLGSAKESGTSLAPTSSVVASLRAGALVIAVPGANVFREDWGQILDGAEVNLLFDNDHPRKHPQTGAEVGLSGYAGMKRVVQVLVKSEFKPATAAYLHWGDGGFDPDLPSGFDVRDQLSQSADLRSRLKLLNELLSKLKPVPADWVGAGGSKMKGSVELDVLPCANWKDLRRSWQEALKWTDGLDRALAVMLAAAASVDVVGDQLWIKVTSPPSGGKSSLCEALSVAKRHVVAKSIIRGFHSGFQTDGERGRDNSLLLSLKGKCLVTKDGDTLLQSPNFQQILAEARDVYDRTSRTHYRNGIARDYEGFSMVWILCGTSSLRALDDSELGQRFLDCVIMDNVDDDLEAEINARRLSQYRELMSSLPGVNGDGADGPEIMKAKRLTGGYLERLRSAIADDVKLVNMPDRAANFCIDCGTLAAYLRARPSSRQSEEVHRELSTRLVLQCAKLAYCLAVVYNKKEVDGDVLKQVRRVALDTGRGRTMQIVKVLQRLGTKGVEAVGLSRLTGHGDQKERELLQFLRQIGVVEKFQANTNLSNLSWRWRLSARLRELYASVVGVGDAGEEGS